MVGREEEKKTHANERHVPPLSSSQKVYGENVRRNSRIHRPRGSEMQNQNGVEVKPKKKQRREDGTKIQEKQTGRYVCGGVYIFIYRKRTE